MPNGPDAQAPYAVDVLPIPIPTQVATVEAWNVVYVVSNVVPNPESFVDLLNF